MPPAPERKNERIPIASAVERRLSIGLLMGLIVGLTAGLHPLNLCFLVLLLWIYRGLRDRLCIAALFLVGCVAAPRLVPPVQSEHPFAGIVSIASAPRIYADRLRFEVSTPEGRLEAKIGGRPLLAYGDRIDLTGRVQPLDPMLEGQKLLRGIRGRLSIDSFQVVSRSAPPFEWAEGVRRSFILFADKTLPARQAAMLSAICFNADTLLDDQTDLELRRTGTVHIVSASGLHVMVLAMAGLWALSRVPIGRKWQVLVAILLLSFYALATGLNPPVVRAVLMAAFTFGAYLFKREPDALSALAIAGIVYLLWKPASVYDIGFQLSFVTVSAFALCLTLPSHSEKRRELLRGTFGEAWSWTKKVAVAGLLASLVSGPLIAYHFGQVSVVGLVANPFIELIVMFLVVAALAAWLLSFGSAALAAWLTGTAILGLLGWVQLVIDAGSSQSWATVSLPDFNAYWLPVIYVSALLLWRPRIRLP